MYYATPFHLNKYCYTQRMSVIGTVNPNDINDTLNWITAPRTRSINFDNIARRSQLRKTDGNKLVKIALCIAIAVTIAITLSLFALIRITFLSS